MVLVELALALVLAQALVLLVLLAQALVLVQVQPQALALVRVLVVLVLVVLDVFHYMLAQRPILNQQMQHRDHHQFLHIFLFLQLIRLIFIFFYVLLF